MCDHLIPISTGTRGGGRDGHGHAPVQRNRGSEADCRAQASGDGRRPQRRGRDGRRDDFGRKLSVFNVRLLLFFSAYERSLPTVDLQ